MTQDQLNAFIATAKSDSALQAKLKNAKTPEETVSIAKAAGFSISQDTLSNSDLSDADLENVAGGFINLCGLVGHKSI